MSKYQTEEKDLIQKKVRIETEFEEIKAHSSIEVKSFKILVVTKLISAAFLVTRFIQTLLQHNMALQKSVLNQHFKEICADNRSYALLKQWSAHLKREFEESLHIPSNAPGEQAVAVKDDDKKLHDGTQFFDVIVQSSDE